MSSGKDLLRIEGLNVSFPLMKGRLHAVNNVNLRILPGKVTALVGESGSGKSVIGQTIMGLHPDSAEVSGSITFDDGHGPVDILKLPRDGVEARAIRGARIGQIFQEPMTSFSPLHTIGDQVSEVLKIHEPGKPEARRRDTEEMLRLVGFETPGAVFDKYPFEMSGGMRQRAMIAMALICRPALLIADEPTTALDVTIQAQIMKLLEDLQDQLGMAVLLITHDLGVVANSADEVVVVYHGQVMEAGPVEAIFRTPGHAYLKGLLGAIPHFDMGRDERLRPLREIETLGGGLMSRMPGAPTESEKAGETTGMLLRVRGLMKTYGSRKGDGWLKGGPPAAPAVDDVGFDIRRGECLGLVGESGCGKTTVSKMLMRAVSADAGEVTFFNGDHRIDVLGAEGAEARILQRRIQMIFQDPVSSLSPRMTVGNILMEPLEIHELGNRASRLDAARLLLKAVGMEDNALRRYPHSFSGGQRQRIGIARALALSPELIVCDEPVSALDVSVQAQVLNLLKDLQRDMGLTYLFISHNLAVVNYMADRVAVMWAGRIVELAPVEVLMSAPVHPYTKALLAAVPYPDLGKPLDYSTAALSSREARKSWAPAFRDAGRMAPADLGHGHYVLAAANADVSELRP